MRFSKKKKESRNHFKKSRKSDLRLVIRSRTSLRGGERKKLRLKNRRKLGEKSRGEQTQPGSAQNPVRGHVPPGEEIKEGGEKK